MYFTAKIRYEGKRGGGEIGKKRVAPFRELIAIAKALPSAMRALSNLKAIQKSGGYCFVRDKRKSIPCHNCRDFLFNHEPRIPSD